jgi:poly-gamma-glutamate capsule biosynthesis protein CapA/YwtB (metallophosphatase superfamily)
VGISASKVPNEKVWEMVVGGDIMLNSVSASTDVFGSWRPSKDVLFYANLEIPLTNTSERTRRKTPEEIARRDQYVLKADPRHIRNLLKGNLDVVSLGNNHAMDGGVSGLNDVLRILDQNKIPRCGAGMNLQEAMEPALVTTKTGIKVAFVSHLSFLNQSSINKCSQATEDEPGVFGLTLAGKSGPTEFERVKAIVDNAKTKADLVFICPHWGIEKMPRPAPFQVSMAHLYIDAGADGVIGNHPHVLQPAEVYKGKPIFYSLGNLVHPRYGNTAVYRVTYVDKEFRSYSFVPLRYSAGRIFRR